VSLHTWSAEAFCNAAVDEWRTTASLSLSSQFSPLFFQRRCFDRFADELCDVIALYDWSAVDVTVPDPEVEDFRKNSQTVAIRPMGRNTNRDTA